LVFCNWRLPVAQYSAVRLETLFNVLR
jgi:hypothetical protein